MDSIILIRTAIAGARYLLLILFVVVLQACSGGSSTNPSDRATGTGTTTVTGFTYSGPVPANSEIQHFKTSFYDNVVTHCGSCHSIGGSGTYAFADMNNVNDAWSAANQKSVVDLMNPSSSRVVERVRNGHHCWLSSTATCASLMTTYVENWAAGASQSTATVHLSPRTSLSVGGVKVAPDTFAEADSLFATGSGGQHLTDSANLMWLLRAHCSGCHSGSSATPQSPFFADTSGNDDVAYAALLGKIDLNSPANSRFVVRLQNQHNCWSGPTGCSSDAATMQKAIQDFADALPDSKTSNLDALVKSAGQVLQSANGNDGGIVASSGGRYDQDVIAKWEFREGEGSLTADTAGVQPEANLTLLGNYQWYGGWGVRLDGGRLQAGVSDSKKLYDRLVATGEYTIEAWVAPNNVTQENAWIFGYAGSPNDRNTLLAQTMYNYDFYNRSSANPQSDASPATSTADDDEAAQASLQHVVLTYDPFNGRKIYVNGVDLGVMDEQGPGNLANWSNTSAIVMGNDFAGNHPWQGVIRMLAIHSRALTQEQILQNYDVGVGQKFFLMFSVSSILDRDSLSAKAGPCHSRDADNNLTEYCYIVYEVSQYDPTSYLFKDPRFVNINPDAASYTLNFHLRGISIGMNGHLVRTGQGFVNIDTDIKGNQFTIDDEPLLRRGSIVPLENGPESDVFFLAFNEIDGQADATPAPTVGSYSYSYPAPDPDIGEERVQVGMRTFDEINETFSSITGIPKDYSVASSVTNKTPSETFNNVRRSLPQVSNFQAFLASQQMAVMQLAAAYCDALVEKESGVGSSTYFSGFDFTQAVGSVSAADWENKVVVPLIDRAYGSGLDLQPTRAGSAPAVYSPGPPAQYDPYAKANRQDVIAEMVTVLINKLAVAPTRTTDVVKAACTAVLASAPATMK